MAAMCWLRQYTRLHVANRNSGTFLCPAVELSQQLQLLTELGFDIASTCQESLSGSLFGLACLPHAGQFASLSFAGLSGSQSACCSTQSCLWWALSSALPLIAILQSSPQTGLAETLLLAGLQGHESCHYGQQG